MPRSNRNRALAEQSCRWSREAAVTAREVRGLAKAAPNKAVQVKGQSTLRRGRVAVYPPYVKRPR